MSSNTTVQWNSQLSLGNAAPDGWELEDFTKNMDDVLTNANKVIDVIEGLVNLASPFITGPTDIVASIIKEFSKPVLTVLRDSLSIGGSFIVIHPFNRMKRRMANILTDEVPFYLPAMTPREAFAELYASFSNTKDPYRPQWTSNINTAGVGVLITLPDVKGFVSLMQSFGKLIDMKDFTDALDTYENSMYEAYASATKAGLMDSSETVPSFLSSEHQESLREVQSKFRETNTKSVLEELGSQTKTDMTNLWESWKPSKISYDFGSSGYGNYPDLVSDKPLPRLHWRGLNISNFTILKQMVDRIEEVIKTLLGFIEVNDKLIDSIMETLLKKVKALRGLVKTAYDLMEGIAISIYSSGIYAFVIPQTPEGETGGVNYIINSLKASLSNPPDSAAKTVSSLLDDSDNTVLFFAGAGVVPNLDAWVKLFGDAFMNVGKTVLTFAQRNELSFSVLPDLDGTTIPFNEGFTLKVLSASSTNDNQLYYTYEIKSKKGTVHSSATSINIFGDAAKVNSSTFKIRFLNPTNVASTEDYSIKITVFNAKLEQTSVTYDFSVSNVATLSSDTVNSEGGAARGTITSGNPQARGLSGGAEVGLGVDGGVIQLIDPRSPTGTEIIQESSFTGIEFAISSLPPFDDPLILKVITNDGDEVSFPINNDTGYSVLPVTIPIKSKYSFDTYPAKLYFDFEGTIAYRLVGSVEWVYITLPGSIPFEGNGTIEYKVFMIDGSEGNNNWKGPFTIKIGKTVPGEINVC